VLHQRIPPLVFPEVRAPRHWITHPPLLKLSDPLKGVGRTVRLIPSPSWLRITVRGVGTGWRSLLNPIFESGPPAVSARVACIVAGPAGAPWPATSRVYYSQ